MMGEIVHAVQVRDLQPEAGTHRKFDFLDSAICFVCSGLHGPEKIDIWCPVYHSNEGSYECLIIYVETRRLN